MKPSIIITILLFFCSIAFTQELPHRPGEYLVQLYHDYTIENLSNDLNNAGTPVLNVKQISKNLKIWELTLSEQYDENDVLETLRKNSSIVNAQLNHVLQNRATIPEDSLFDKQWQYVNNGSSISLADADIDMDEAWDETTGGLTFFDDTIVVAVVDDGFDTLHPDFEDNVWFNKNEIQDNNIDDDNNGYIDDFWGWNSYENNGDIKDGKWGGEHGTSVAGIIGAKGNNKIGVSGVNWDVKLLNVVGGGDESDAVAAYSYVFDMRKLFNETNGAKGAYIVTTNASWGLDYLKAADAPLWCAMYDSLGKQGILNVGATSNLNINVDEQGDMPSTCASKFLIIVTNTDDNDRKVSSAGYGPIHVDLGAPGDDVYTTASTIANSDGYEYFSGTSGAAPHVTGVIALLYAAACEDLMIHSQNYPDSVALLMKKFILEGTDPLNTLISKTTSGGRLNAYGAIKQLKNWCNPGSVENLYGNRFMVTRIYPNPASESLNIEFYSGKIRPLNVHIYDVLGQEVSNEQISVFPGRDTQKIDISQNRSGIYFIKVLLADGTSVYTEKFIKK